MATLAGSSISSSYEQLLSLPDGGGNGATLVAVTDGDAGTTFALELATDKIRSTGDIRLASAKGIDFSDAGTAAEILDDYEEGTHTATMTAGSGTITLNGSNDTLSYTKIGRVVHVQGQLVTTGTPSPSGLLKISLPFTIGSLTETSDRGSFSLRVNSLTGSPGVMLGGFDEVQDALVISEYSAGNLTNAADHVGGSSEFNISATYFTA